MTNSLTISDLAKVVKDSNLPTGKAEALEAAFMPFFEAASAHCETAFSIKVTNIAQTAEMAKAKKAWKELKDSRIAKENKRKQVKEYALLECRTIDKIGNFLDSVTVPMEKYLEDQWKYGERLQQTAQAEQRDLRTCEAGDLIQYFPNGIDLGVIADEEFAQYLHLATVQSNAIRAENERIERERIEREQREAAEREAMRVENERLKAEAARVEAERAKEREAAEKAQREADAVLAAQRAEMERLRDESLAKEAAERKRIMEENRLAMERDNAERERIRKEQEEKEAAEKAALEAPDREKLLVYAKSIMDLKKPKFATESADQKFGRAWQKISEAIHILQS
jgi:hypothetical protein